MTVTTTQIPNKLGRVQFVTLGPTLLGGIVANDVVTASKEITINNIVKSDKAINLFAATSIKCIDQAEVIAPNIYLPAQTDFKLEGNCKFAGRVHYGIACPANICGTEPTQKDNMPEFKSIDELFAEAQADLTKSSVDNNKDGTKLPIEKFIECTRSYPFSYMRSDLGGFVDKLRSTKSDVFYVCHHDAETQQADSVTLTFKSSQFPLLWSGSPTLLSNTNSNDALVVNCVCGGEVADSSGDL